MPIVLSCARFLTAAALTWSALSGRHWFNASQGVRDAQAQLDSVADKADEILRLRQIQPTALLNAKPVESVSGPLRAALRAAGLTDDALRSVTGSSDEASTDAGNQTAYRRLSVSVQVSPISTRQLGLFLAEWTRMEPAWVVTRLDLTHIGPETDPDSTYDLRLTIATTYLSSNPKAP